MPSDTLDPTSPENIENGIIEDSPTTKKKRGWPGHRAKLPDTISQRDLALELIRRIDINRELRDANRELTSEDGEILRVLCGEWDRLRLLRSGGIPKQAIRRLGGWGTTRNY